MESIDKIIEVRINQIFKSYESRINSLEKEVKELNSIVIKQGVWLTMNEIESKFGITKRTQYRKMNSNEYNWKKPNGGQRIIEVGSIF